MESSLYTTRGEGSSRQPLYYDPTPHRQEAVRRLHSVVVVVSEGLGADWLAEHKAEAGLDNLFLLGFQPFERMSEVLASADVLLAILEADAGVFSVPSKVLGYLCAGRAILASVPPENLAARILVHHEAGLTVDADDAAGLAVAADRLIAEPGVRERLGQNGLEYAKRTFDIDAITTRFEAVIARATGGRAGI